MLASREYFAAAGKHLIVSACYVQTALLLMLQLITRAVIHQNSLLLISSIFYRKSVMV